MHNDEIDNFHQMIDESYLKINTAKKLHSVVNEFLGRDYGVISQKYKKKCEYDFEIRRSKVYLGTGAIEIENVDEIFDSMRQYLDLILDKSVDLSKVEKGTIEKILSALPTINISFFKKLFGP